MRSFAFLAILSLVAAQQPNYWMKWLEWKKQYGHVFIGEAEEAKRFEIFKKNVDTIYEYNSKNLSYELGVNEYTHLDPDEFASNHFGYKKPEKAWGELPYLGRHVYSGDALPSFVDWTTKGAVTRVKNQGQCGSCWAFSTVGSLEGAWQVKTGKLVSLSEQELVDCDKVDDACSGGLMDNGFKFAEKNDMCTEESYPYKAKKGRCRSSSCTVGIPQGGVTGYKDVGEESMKSLMEAVAQQPVSIAIEADKMVFQSYRRGVLTGNCGSQLDHGVLAVGYGVLKRKKYWKVKNSWGSSWGMSGYVLIARGKPGKGECGLLSGPPSYPVVSGKPGPSPPTPPTPSPPAPPTPGTTHYEKPPCQSDEVEASVEQSGGSVCAPPCDSESECPMDKPAGTSAKPMCLLQDSGTGQQYCALACRNTSNCPTGAKCALASPLSPGICVYPDDECELCERTTLRMAQKTGDVITV